MVAKRGKMLRAPNRQAATGQPHILMVGKEQKTRWRVFLSCTEEHDKVAITVDTSQFKIKVVIKASQLQLHLRTLSEKKKKKKHSLRNI